MKVACYIERDSETDMYVAFAPSIPGVRAKAENLDDLIKNLKEGLELCLNKMSEEEKEMLPESELVGLLQLDV